MGVSTAEIYVQAFIAIFMIVNPIDPVKIIIFNDVVDRQRLGRLAAAAKVSGVTFVILGVAALAGRELLELIGINLGAFGVVGGLVVALMGFEMLYGGGSSRTQGTKEAAAEPSEQEGLILPLATPLMAGPGAITTVITVSTYRDDFNSLLAAVAGVALVAALVFISFGYLSGLFSRLKPTTTAMLARFGGLLLATIGAQLVLGGIRTFYKF